MLLLNYLIKERQRILKSNGEFNQLIDVLIRMES